MQVTITNLFLEPGKARGGGGPASDGVDGWDVERLQQPLVGPGRRVKDVRGKFPDTISERASPVLSTCQVVYQLLPVIWWRGLPTCLDVGQILRADSTLEFSYQL